MNDTDPLTSWKADRLASLREFSDTALTRMWLSEAAGIAASHAIEVGSTVDADAVRLFEKAQSLQCMAGQVLDCLVVWAKQAGRSWDEIGGMLDMSKQAAHERWGKAYERWQSKLVDGSPSIGGHDAQAHLQYLDQIVRNPNNKHDGKLVSAGLPERTLADSFTEVAMRSRIIEQRVAAGQSVPAEITADLEARQQINRDMMRQQESTTAADGGEKS